MAALVQCTIYGNTSPVGSGISECGMNVNVSSSIIAFNQGGAAYAGGPATFSCSDLFANQGGDWVGPIANQFGISGNISEDPLFCNPSQNDFDLRDDSPCRGHTPEDPNCERMGAWPVGCSADVAGSGPGLTGCWIQVMPNPSRGACRIVYTTVRPDAPRMAVFDAAGRMVRLLDSSWLSPGEHFLSWDGKGESGQELSSGVYLVRMMGGQSAIGRLTLIR